MLAIGVGIYPLLYFFMNESQGLLSQKSPDVLASTVWNLAFRLHIFLGGLSLISGCLSLVPDFVRKGWNCIAL